MQFRALIGFLTLSFAMGNLAQAKVFQSVCMSLWIKSRAAGLTVRHSGPPQLIANQMKKSGLHWYEYSAQLPDATIDPIYPALAKKLGENTILLGGGSDLVQTELGLRKNIALVRNGTEYAAEVNLIMKEDISLLDAFKTIDLQIPGFEGRPTGPGTVSINNESNNDLDSYLDNGKNGRPLINGREATLTVPLKHSAVIEIDQQGHAKIYFRTQEDLENYINHRLTLPDQKKISIPKWLKNFSGKKDRFLAVVNTLRYSTVVEARAWAKGWRYDADSLRFLRGLARVLTKSERKEILLEVQEQVTDPVAKANLKSVLDDLGINQD